MKLGDLVEFEGQRWVVRRVDTVQATLLDAKGQTRDVAHDLDLTGGCKVLANPATEWPCLTVRDNPKGMFLVGLARPKWVSSTRPSGHTALQQYVDWVPSDPARAGGTLFINPELHVQPAEVLLVQWKKGATTPLKVPVHFGTVSQRVARAERKKPAEVTVYDRLLDDRFDDEDA